MTMPSLLTWVIGAAVLVVLSVLLRYVANEAHELARSRGRASIAREPESASMSRKAPWQGRSAQRRTTKESPLAGHGSS
jgi:hypothetical protein